MVSTAVMGLETAIITHWIIDTLLWLQPPSRRNYGRYTPPVEITALLGA